MRINTGITLKHMCMKTIVLSFLLFMCGGITVFAQKDVTTFLGIPIDGYKPEMKKALIAKGFSQSAVPGADCLEGEFNGTDVNVYIVTNNNKVYRIMLCDKNTQNEANIKIRFNNLVSQFANNKRYTALEDYTIPEGEDMSYEMVVHKKNYDAIFYQNPSPEKIDTLEIQSRVKTALLAKYTEEQLANPTEDITKDIQAQAIQIGMEILFKKPVWFRICENYGKYYISMFYDNEYNHANGEDL